MANNNHRHVAFKRKFNLMAKCPTCKGDGVLKTPQYLKINPDEIYHDMMCDTCNGTGIVDDDDNLDRVPGPITKWLLRLALIAGTYILFQIIFK